MVQARLAQTKKDRADKEDRDSDRDCAGHRRDGRVREVAQQERTNDELAGHVCEHDMSVKMINSVLHTYEVVLSTKMLIKHRVRATSAENAQATAGRRTCDLLVFIHNRYHNVRFEDLIEDHEQRNTHTYPANPAESPAHPPVLRTDTPSD